MAPEPPAGDITTLLRRHHAGDRAAFDELVTLAYHHLRKIARGQLARMGPSDTASATGLVHEAYGQLVRETGVAWENRGHFYAIAARAMRRILVDHARRQHARKRGRGIRPMSIDSVPVGVDEQLDLVLAVDQALSRLGGIDGRLARLVECRFFAGMTEEETAEALQVSVRTVQRDWMRARAWLIRDLEGGPAAPPLAGLGGGPAD